MATTFRDGNVTITLDDGLERLARRAAERVLPGVLQQVEAEVDAVLAEARQQWPVRTGKSKAALERLTEFTDSGVIVKIVNRVPYAPFVRPAKFYGATTAWARLVQLPTRKLHRELAKRLGRRIVEALRG